MALRNLRNSTLQTEEDRMTDRPTESASTPLDDAGAPHPLSSGDSEGQRPSAEGLDVAALADALAPVLTPVLTKAVREQLGGEVAQQTMAQSNKDQRMKVLDAFKGVDPQTLKTFADHLKDNGNDVEKALRDTRRDVAIDAIARGEFPVSGEGAVPGRTDAEPAKPKSEAEMAADITTEILSEAEIDFEDPGYKQFVLETRKAGAVKTAAQWEKSLRSWAIKQARQRAIPEGAVSPEGRGRPPVTEGEKKLRSDYEKRKSELRPGDVEGLYAIKQEFRKKGLADLF